MAEDQTTPTGTDSERTETTPTEATAQPAETSAPKKKKAPARKSGGSTPSGRKKSETRKDPESDDAKTSSGASETTHPAPDDTTAAEPDGGGSPVTQKPRRSSAPRGAQPLFSADVREEREISSDADTPRLAAAALLFQAPDLTAAPPRRRTQNDAPTDGPGPEGAGQDPRRDDSRLDDGGADTSGDGGGSDGDRTDGPRESTETGSTRRRRGSRGRRRSASDEASDAAESAERSGEVSDTGSSDEQTPSGQQGRRGGRPSGEEAASEGTQQNGGSEGRTPGTGSSDGENTDGGDTTSSSSRRRRRRRSRSTSGSDASSASRAQSQVTSVEGSTRLEAKRQRRREGREAGRRRQVITEAEFLARREAVDRQMLVRERDGLNQIAVLEDGVLVEHYVARRTQTSMVGNVYLGRVQNVLPSMEAAFVDLGKGRNAVLYAGEVNWDAVGAEGQPRRIEQALKSGDSVMVQVTKDPIGHKGARLTSQITLAGRHLVLVPSGSMTGISRKLPENERARLKKLLKEIVPNGFGVIVRTAAEGATEEQLRDDVARLVKSWEDIQAKAESARSAPVLLKGEPELAVRVVRDVFNEDFTRLVVSGRDAYRKISDYVTELSPDLADRVDQWVENTDLFSTFRVDEQLAKGMDRKVWLPSGGSLVIDRTEAMTVVDVNTGRFTGSGGSLEETVTKNNLEAAEEIVRQLRLRDIGGIIVIDFIDMVLESNRDLVLRRLIECLGRDRTRHQVAEVTSLGLVQMTRKRVGQGLVEAFSETCQHCMGRGFVVHSEPVEKSGAGGSSESGGRRGRRSGGNGGSGSSTQAPAPTPEDEANRQAMRATMATIAAAAANAHEAAATSGADASPAVDTPAEAAAAAKAPPAAGDPTPKQDASASTDGGVAPAEDEREQGSGTAETGATTRREVVVRQRAEVATTTRAARGGRRRVVAAGAPQDSDPASAIIALPVPQPEQETAKQEPPLSPSLLDSLVFPERSEDTPARPKRQPRRATAPAHEPPPADNPAVDATEATDHAADGDESPATAEPASPAPDGEEASSGEGESSSDGDEPSDTGGRLDAGEN